MSEKLKERINQITSRIPVVKGRGEEATKQALILPLLDALGYDIWNPGEVCPEFSADFATKKSGQKEKVDLAILLGDVPRIFFEVKSVDTALDGHEGQLARYFNSTKTVSLAVLTNGIEYRFFTDTGEPNIMDSTPFEVIQLDALDQGMDILLRFSRLNFSPESVRGFATDIQYTSKMVTFLRNELDLRSRDPGDIFMRWLLAAEGMYDGRVTSTVVDRFRPIAKNALQLVLRDIVRRSVAALDEGVSASAPAPAAAPAAPAPVPVIEQSEATEVKARIVTLADELAGFHIVREQFQTSALSKGTIFDPSQKKEVPIEIGSKDTTGYYGIYFNKSSWWVLRLCLEGKQKWVGVNLSQEKATELLPSGFSLLPSTSHADTRILINSVNDLHSLNRVVYAAMVQTVEDRKQAVQS